MNHRAWVATRKGLFELQRQGESWQIERVSFLGEPVSMLLPPDGGGQMLAALNLGHFGVKVHASADAGASWNEVATPAYPEQPKDAAGPAWKLVQIWALERTGSTIWAGTLPGGLFRSSNGGASWQLIESLWNRTERLEWFGGGYDVPGIHSICPHPQRPQEILLGVSCGGVWATRDGGETWANCSKGMKADFMPPEQADNPNIQDPHCIVRSPAAPDRLWCQQHGGIWKSDDNAGLWTQVTTAPLSSFGFAAAVHPQDPDTAWFVPGVADQQRVPVGAAMAVNRTRDGGKTFETLRAGLPQRHCYDLVYRHGLAAGSDGRTLLVGSTTGSLWGSFDGGEHWHAVSPNLPPIAAVRIG